MKRIVVAVLSFCMLISVTSAQDLNGFANDFEALIVGVTRDVAPNLQMTALSGNVVGDATIDRFMFFIPAIGVTITDGLGSVLVPGERDWEFLIPMPSIITQVVDDEAMTDNIEAIEGRFFPYPTLKLGVGFGLGHGFDAIISGMYIPAAITKTILEQAGGDIGTQGISFDTYNIGVEIRKTVMKDEGFKPALSLGMLYNFAGLNLEVGTLSLAKLTDGGIEVGEDKLDLTGSMSFNTAVHNFGFDLHASKHLLFFMPYAKFTGVYQIAETKGDVDMTAPLGDTMDQLKIRTNPVVQIANFSSLVTFGFELNLFAFIFNANAVVDLARAELDISDFSLTGITGQGVTGNIGFRWQF